MRKQHTPFFRGLSVPRPGGCQMRGAAHAFTLIELLVVIGVIAILAGMIVAVAGTAKQKAVVKRVQGHLAQLDTAISRYQLDRASYPPDNGDIIKAKRNETPANFEKKIYRSKNTPAAANSLYYELSGVVLTNNGNTYIAPDGVRVNSGNLKNAFQVGGVFNSTLDAVGDAAKNYIPDLKAAQTGRYNEFKLMGTDIDGPIKLGDGSPFCYVSSAPLHNRESVDLWVDIHVGSKTNRISNWSDEAEEIGY